MILLDGADDLLDAALTVFPPGKPQGRKTFGVPAKAGTQVAVDSRLRGNDGRFSWLFAGRRPMETDLGKHEVCAASLSRRTRPFVFMYILASFAMFWDRQYTGHVFYSS